MPDGPGPGRKVTVIGCGLIGGSICLALRRRRPGWTITCLDLPERQPAIAAAGVADETGTIADAAAHLPGSALVVLAAPVEVILEQLEALAPHLRAGTVVTDVGSTKASVMERARAVLPDGVCFIGGHPVAGAEVSGVEAADPLLFKDRVYMLCPCPDTPAEALLFLIDVVEDLLAWPVTIEPEEHDRILAMVSHVPQLMAVALVHAALEDDATHKMLDLIAGRGFLEQTRIAASEYEVWRGILKTNRPSIRAALDRLDRSLTRLRAAMDDEVGDGDLALLWGAASQRRRRMGHERLPRMRLPELRQAIDRCDAELLGALSRRMQVAARIGELKREQGAPVHDPARERTMLSRRHEWARTLGLSSDLIEELFALVIKHSRALQSRPGGSAG